VRVVFDCSASTGFSAFTKIWSLKSARKILENYTELVQGLGAASPSRILDNKHGDCRVKDTSQLNGYALGKTVTIQTYPVPAPDRNPMFWTSAFTRQQRKSVPNPLPTISQTPSRQTVSGDFSREWNSSAS